MKYAMAIFAVLIFIWAAGLLLRAESDLTAIAAFVLFCWSGILLAGAEISNQLEQIRKKIDKLQNLKGEER